MHYFIYETTNLINGKKYRGYHSTRNLDDGYMGSGTAIMQAVDKYGKENFKREILEMCESLEHALEREEFYVDDEWVKDDNNYNLIRGGKRLLQTSESKLKLGKTIKDKYEAGEIAIFGVKKGEKKIPWNKGKKTGPNKKLSEAKKGKLLTHTIWNKGGSSWNKDIKTGELSTDHKQKISESLQKKYESSDHGKKGKRYPGSMKGKRAPNKGVPAPKITCPYCSIEVGGRSNYQRWHGENCKQKS